MEIKKNQDPIKLFVSWMEEAKLKEINDPEAMALSTVSLDGNPSVRMVLFFLQIIIVENLRKFLQIPRLLFVCIGNL